MLLAFRLWQSAESVILQKHRFCRQSKSTTSTKAKSSLRLMMYTTSTRLHSKFRLFAVQRIWAKLCGELQKVIRTKGEPGTGDIVQAVRHMRMMNKEIARLTSMRTDELYEAAKQLQVPYDLVCYVHENGRLPVVNFAAGGVATPADAALMMQLGAEGVFVGSGIFKSGNPEKRASAIVKAVTNYNDAAMLAELSEDLGEAMVGINEQEIALLMAERGK